MTASNGRTTKMLNVIQVADDLNVSTKTVRRMIEDGELHYHRFGRAIRVSQDDLRAFVSSKRG